jgi:hypothetical protein
MRCLLYRYVCEHNQSIVHQYLTGITSSQARAASGWPDKHSDALDRRRARTQAFGRRIAVFQSDIACMPKSVSTKSSFQSDRPDPS